jgi:hypothetical protein
MALAFVSYKAKLRRRALTPSHGQISADGPHREVSADGQAVPRTQRLRSLIRQSYVRSATAVVAIKELGKTQAT